jgi:mannosyl-oligosaccharide glucosidase
MAVASELMGDLADLLGYDRSKYVATHNTLKDPDLLDSLHWSDELSSYADYGLHSTKTVLKRISKPDSEFSHHHHVEKERVTLIPPKYGFVNVFGYISLFPMLLQILTPNSEKLLAVLNKIHDTNLLWTPYGLRSLAATAPFYNARNTEHDPPYWRGPIWINMNFLALKSLKHYSTEGKGAVATLSKEKYTKLRENIIENIMRQYYKSGYIWEQYNDVNGDGKGCRPFTGWSALVVLIMAEEY